MEIHKYFNKGAQAQLETILYATIP